MTIHPTRSLIAAAGALALLAGAPAVADEDMEYYKSVFDPLPALPPIPADNSLTPAKVELGKMLFFEPRLSSSGVISCATCHNPALGWADRLPRGTGHEGQIGLRNTPTVLNSGFLPNQFWDGREPDLEGQALGPIQAPDEMAMDIDEALKRIEQFDVYIEHFARAFPDEENPINAQNVAYAMASFERTLNTPNSPFDRFLRGDSQAMSDAQVRGMMAFVDNGCVACHQGPALTDGNFHRFDLPGPTDLGRFVVTGEEHDRYAFRTPTLRNVAVTYPYFHNGSIDNLHDAVNLMGEQMLGQEFDDDTLDDIVAFLHALTGEMPQVTIPALP